MVPAKTEESTILLGNWIARFRGFKLMEINVATAVFQVVSQYFGLGNFDILFFFKGTHSLKTKMTGWKKNHESVDVSPTKTWWIFHCHLSFRRA